MASACRSAVTACARNFTARPSLIFKTPTPKPLPSSPFFSFTRPSRSAALRVASVLGSAESMMPLHSAIASARLKSSIALDSTCWSWLSQGIAIPL